MAGTITKLGIQKKNKERVNVFLDEKYSFAVTLNVALELKKGQFLSDVEIERFKQQDDRHKAYDRAIFYLGFRARSRSEVERYLKEKEYAPDIITGVVTRLIEEKYLNDDEFAQTWVSNREQLKPKSKRALQYELRQKGVGQTAIESALSELDEDDAAHRALESKLWQWQQLDQETFKKKAMGFLSRRGFGYHITRDAVDTAWDEIAKSQDDASN